ncbi:MAG: Lar family restriction alleviation protein [Zoogloeaceae bacterium]|jgi:hypothetical protein|nr:Lar family restriction alleviation protein [Zoogloeaceae bacterium]
MTHLEREGWGACPFCGERIAIKRTRNGLAYYRCDGCGVHVQHNWRSQSEEFLRKHGIGAAKSGETPGKAEKTAEKTTDAPAKAVKSGALAEIFGD